MFGSTGTPFTFRSARPDVYDSSYHFEPGEGIADVNGENADADNGFDGTARTEAPFGGRETPGPFFINAGTFFYNLDVVSVTLTQHF